MTFVTLDYRGDMRISDVIRSKGPTVITVRREDTVKHVVTLMKEHHIGAVVVCDDDAHVVGLVSERDVVSNLRSGLFATPVSHIMTEDVQTCDPDEDVEALARTMTAGRFRHVPVVVDGKLLAIVSVGDVVKHYIDQLTDERDHLVGYLNQ